MGGVRFNAVRFAGMVVERHIDAIDIGKVRRNHILVNVYQAVLHVFGMGEGNIVDNAKLFQENSANQTVHIGARDQAVFFGGVGFEFGCAHGGSLLATSSIY